MALPDKPENSVAHNYFKMKEPGTKKVRILTDFIAYYQAWVDKKPMRRDQIDQFPDSTFDNGKPPRLAWACAVWNYADSRIQVWEITQAGIRKTLKALAKDDEWGEDFKGYDIKVTRSGMGLEDTEWTLMPSNKSPLAKDIAVQWDAVSAFDSFDLSALLTNGDPFNPKR